MPLTAVVLGATGLTGSHVTQLLLNDPAFSKVTILVRRPVELTHPKLQVAVIDFSNLVQFRQSLGEGDCIFCCVGTTMSQVKGDKVAYRKVDYDIAVNAAAMGKDAGFTKYLLISAVRANAASRFFYVRLKGEVEKAIANIHYPAFHVFRPGIVYGEREKFRVAEPIVKGIMSAIGFLFPSKYRSIAGADVAKAMVAAAKTNIRGMVVHHWKDMKRLMVIV